MHDEATDQLENVRQEAYDIGYEDGYKQAIVDTQASKKKLASLGGKRRETYQAPTKRKGKHSA